MFFKLKNPSNNLDYEMSCSNIIKSNNELIDRYQRLFENKNATLGKNYKRVLDEFRQNLTRISHDQDETIQRETTKIIKSTPPICCSTPSPIIDYEVSKKINVPNENSTILQSFNNSKPTNKITPELSMNYNSSFDSHEKNIENFSSIPIPLPPHPTLFSSQPKSNYSLIRNSSNYTRRPSHNPNRNQQNNLSSTKTPRGFHKRPRYYYDNNNTTIISKKTRAVDDSTIIIDKIKDILLDMHSNMKPLLPVNQTSFFSTVAPPPTTLANMYFKSPQIHQLEQEKHQLPKISTLNSRLLPPLPNAPTQPIINIYSEEIKHSIQNDTTSPLVDKLLKELIKKLKQKSNQNAYSTNKLNVSRISKNPSTNVGQNVTNNDLNMFQNEHQFMLPPTSTPFFNGYTPMINDSYNNVPESANTNHVNHVMINNNNNNFLQQSMLFQLFQNQERMRRYAQYLQMSYLQSPQMASFGYGGTRCMPYSFGQNHSHMHKLHENQNYTYIY
jgi:hypothetical protein